MRRRVRVGASFLGSSSITFVTTAPGDDLAFALLKELGMPFRGNDKTGARL